MFSLNQKIHNQSLSTDTFLIIKGGCEIMFSGLSISENFSILAIFKTALPTLKKSSDKFYNLKLTKFQPHEYFTF